MRVLVVDDSLIVRQGLSHMLEAAGVSVVGQLDGPATLMARVKMDRPDVVLLDIRMPPTHTTEGILAAEQLRSVYPELAVLVLSQFVEPSYALRLLHDHPEGMGYLLKDRIHDPAVLIDALRRLTESETVVDPTIVARLLGRKRVKDPLEVLSMREREILALVAEGLANRAIADRLSITDRTVEAHVARIFVKLDLSEDPCSNRRILAVLTYLRAEAV